ncbi:hypothetical protein LBMAG42_48330 [Deltaproteobacteria bacterium]|nr:hypothetical protein LBMAG42_48330 [Deltaproteobacteria bacterium]
MITLLMASHLAQAGTIEAWEARKFPADGETIAGEDGWVNGYDEDEWGGTESGNELWAFSYTDHNDDGRFGDGGAHDNWLVNAAEPVMQGAYTVTSWTNDNDAFGVVFGFDEGRYYMLLVCGEEGNDTSTQTCPISGLTTQAVALVEVTGAGASVIDSVEHGCTGGTELEFSIAMDDGQLVASYGRVELTMEVDTDFHLDGVGFYAYNDGFIDESGEDDGDSIYFRDPALVLQDEDDDEVADDSDNCEEEPNTDQADLDHDGIGSACDLSEETGGDDTGDTGSVDDTGDTGKGNGNGNGPGNGGITISHNDCGCDSAGAPGVGLLALAGLAALRRKRG